VRDLLKLKIVRARALGRWPAIRRQYRFCNASTTCGDIAGPNQCGSDPFVLIYGPW